MMWNSTRRLRARPSGLSFVETALSEWGMSLQELDNLKVEVPEWLKDDLAIQRHERKNR